jgi:hypothetical protein
MFMMENIPLEIWDLIFINLNKFVLAFVCKMWYFIIQDLGIKPIDYQFTKTSNPSVHAAFHGDYNILMWLRDQRCRMEWETKAAAILNGSQQIIDFVNHIPLSEKLFVGIVKTGQEAPFLWLRRNRCPYPKNILVHLYRTGNYDFIEYFRWDIDFVITPKSFKLPTINGNLRVIEVLDSFCCDKTSLKRKIYKKVIWSALKNNQLGVAKWGLKRIKWFQPDFIPLDKKDKIKKILNNQFIGNMKACRKLEKILCSNNNETDSL